MLTCAPDTFEEKESSVPIAFKEIGNDTTLFQTFWDIWTKRGYTLPSGIAHVLRITACLMFFPEHRGRRLLLYVRNDQQISSTSSCRIRRHHCTYRGSRHDHLQGTASIYCSGMCLSFPKNRHCWYLCATFQQARYAWTPVKEFLQLSTLEEVIAESGRVNPFQTKGFVIVDSDTKLETYTYITLSTAIIK